jgi:transcription initiation factor TFIID TATA-box-binding protein
MRTEFTMLKIVSMVTICVIDQTLDVQHISMNVDGAVLSKDGGKFVKFRLMPENYYILFYKSGKILITGIKSLKKVNDACQSVLSILSSAGINARITKNEIVNIVCLGTLQLNTTLEKIVCSLDSCDVSYEPEQFPGLIYKNWGATFLLFSSGKVIITGIKDLKNANGLLERFEKIIHC